MTPKKIAIYYWVFTILFGGLMIFSAIGGIEPSQQSIQILHDGMGYPIYFIQFISVAKLLGSIAILIPGFNNLKEWAYAGLFFDLIGAIYSGIAATGKFDPMMLSILLWAGTGILSYYFWKKQINR